MLDIMELCEDLLDCKLSLCQKQHPRSYQGVCIKHLKMLEDENYNQKQCNNDNCKLYHPDQNLFYSWLQIEPINGIRAFNLCPSQCELGNCPFAHRIWAKNKNLCINNLISRCRKKDCQQNHQDWRSLKKQIDKEYNFYNKNPEDLCEEILCNCEQHIPIISQFCIRYLKGTCPNIQCQKTHIIWEDVKQKSEEQKLIKPCLELRKFDSFFGLKQNAIKSRAQVYCEKQQLEKFRRQLNNSNFVDLLFIIDLTASMQPWKDVVEKNVVKIIDSFKNTTKGYSFRVGFVGYRDICDGDNQIVYRNFTQKLDEITYAIHKEKATGGGDIAEDIVAGLEQGLKLNICRNSNSILCTFLICDAPCHGKQYHELKSDDNKENVKERHLEDVIKKYKEFKQNSFFTCIKINQTTNKMFKIMKEEFPDLMITQQIQPHQFENLVNFSLSQSIQQTQSRIKKDNQIKKLCIEAKFQKFKVRKSESAQQNYKQQFWQQFVEFIDQFDRKGETTLEIDIEPENSLNKQSTYIFKIFDSVHNQYMVAKVPKQHYDKYTQHSLTQEDIIFAEESAKVRYITACIANQMSYYFRTKVNNHQNYPPIFYVFPILYTLEEPVFGIKQLYAETFIDIKQFEWKKFTTNGSYSNPSYYFYSAFSHFSLQESQGQLVIVDLQGLETIFTDASVQTKRGFIPFLEKDKTNRLDEGIFTFTDQQHQECNELCQILNLSRDKYFKLQSQKIDSTKWKLNNNQYINVICEICNDFGLYSFDTFRQLKSVKCDYCIQTESEPIQAICRCCQGFYKQQPNVDLLTQTLYGFCEKCKQNCFQRNERCHYCQFKCQQDIKKVQIQEQDYWFCSKALQYLKIMKCQICSLSYDFKILIDQTSYANQEYKCMKHL